MKRAGLYARVSTLEQANNGYSIVEQKERLTKYAQSQGFSIVDIYADEGASGKSLVRPEIERLISDIKSSKIDIVLIYKLDRLSRRVIDVLELVELFDKYNVTLFSLSENIDLSSPFGRASLKMSATFSELERETIVERVAMGKDAKAKSGLYSCPGKCPFGYRLVKGEGRFVIEEREAEAIRDMISKYISGTYTFRKLYKYCKEKYPDINFFSYDLSCKNVVQRLLYAGYFMHNDEMIKAINVPPIISYETHLQALAQVKKNTTKRERETTPFLLTGLIVCGKCGYRYGGKTYKHTIKNKNGSISRFNYTRYGCMVRLKKTSLTKGLHCDNEIIEASVLENHISNAVKNFHFNEFIESVKSTGVIDKLVIENSELKKQKDKLLDLYMTNVIDKEAFVLRTNELDKKINKNNVVIKNEQNTISTTPTVSIDYLKERQANYDNASKKEKRELLQLLINEIVVDGQNITIKWNVK